MGGDGVFDEPSGEGPAEIERPRQRPMEVDRNAYYETGTLMVGVGGDGLPVIGGGAPEEPEEGITDDNLVCGGAPGRLPCEHYIAVLLRADGVAKGFGDMKQIRRFCKRLSTAAELFEVDIDIYACTSRNPPDAPSAALIDDFEARQKAVAEEAAEKSGTLDF
jgi:hypothetical protein